MEATVTHLIQLVAADRKALRDQLARSAATYGTSRVARWPAATAHAVLELQATLLDRQRRLSNARTYLAELHAQQGATT